MTTLISELKDKMKLEISKVVLGQETILDGILVAIGVGGIPRCQLEKFRYLIVGLMMAKRLQCRYLLKFLNRQS